MVVHVRHAVCGALSVDVLGEDGDPTWVTDEEDDDPHAIETITESEK